MSLVPLINGGMGKKKKKIQRFVTRRILLNEIGLHEEGLFV